MCYISRQIDDYLDYDVELSDYQNRYEDCPDCKNYNEKLNQIADCLEGLIEELQGKEMLDQEYLHYVLKKMADQLDIKLDVLSLNIERPAESIKMLNKYLHKLSK